MQVLCSGDLLQRRKLWFFTWEEGSISHCNIISYLFTYFTWSETMYLKNWCFLSRNYRYVTTTRKEYVHMEVTADMNMWSQRDHGMLHHLHQPLFSVRTQILLPRTYSLVVYLVGSIQEANFWGILPQRSRLSLVDCGMVHRLHQLPCRSRFHTLFLNRYPPRVH